MARIASKTWGRLTAPSWARPALSAPRLPPGITCSSVPRFASGARARVRPAFRPRLGRPPPVARRPPGGPLESPLPAPPTPASKGGSPAGALSLEFAPAGGGGGQVPVQGEGHRADFIYHF